MAKNMFFYWFLNLTDDVMRDEDKNFPETLAYHNHETIFFAGLFPNRKQTSLIKRYVPLPQRGKLVINWGKIRNQIRERLIIRRSPLQPLLRHYRSG